MLISQVIYQQFLTAMLAAALADRTVEKLTGEKRVTGRLTKSVPHNITSEMGLALCRVSDVIRKHPPVVAYLKTAGEEMTLEGLRNAEGGVEAASALERFLAEFGMRCPGEIDVTRARFRERPGLLTTSLLNNVQNLPEGYATAAFAGGAEETQTAIDELADKMKAARGKRKAGKLRRQIEIYRKFIGVREYTKYFWMSYNDVFKQAILREAARLVQQTVLRDIKDVYYLSLDELLEVAESGQANHSLIEEHKAAYRSYAALTPPRIIFSDGEVPPVSYQADIPDGALAGLPVSAGIVEGRARVVQSLAQANLEKGDILVTMFTDPSWTPVFVSIAGLVTEIGGMMSHGAVITREYGLPAVVGVPDATKLIRDGQRIRLNGATGYVEIL
jgi:pyruvate,water dikinase